jgi:hypothetical protein
MKAIIKKVNGRNYLVVNIPSEYVGVHSIPVITKGSRDDYKKKHPEYPCVWSWNGDLVNPTVKPSLAITTTRGSIKKVFKIHLFLNDGICKFLSDCNDGSANKELPLDDLPDWAIKDAARE